jgi:hypothetical protein
MASGPHWRKSAGVQVAKDTILAQYRQLVAKKTAANSAARPADGAPIQRSRIWWLAWLARTPAAVTTALWERWPG